MARLVAGATRAAENALGGVVYAQNLAWVGVAARPADVDDVLFRRLELYLRRVHPASSPTIFLASGKRMTLSNMP